MYKLTKKVLQGESARLLSISSCGEWLTNGGWMVRRNRVEGGDLLGNQAAVSLKYGKLAEPPDYKLHEVGRCIPCGPWVRYTRTRFAVAPLTDHGFDFIVYQGEDESIAYVQRINADFLGLELFSSKAQGPPKTHRDGYVVAPLVVLQGEEVKAVVMPVRGNGSWEVAAFKRALFGGNSPC